MAVHVDEAGQQHAAARVDDGRIRRDTHAPARARRENSIAGGDDDRVVYRRRAGAVDEARAVDRDRPRLGAGA